MEAEEPKGIAAEEGTVAQVARFLERSVPSRRCMKAGAIFVCATFSAIGCSAETTTLSSGDSEVVAGTSVAQAEYDAEYPWMLAMAYQDEVTPDAYVVHCGAELIGPDVVLTAGHCVSTRDGGSMVRDPGGMMFARGTVHTTEMSPRVDDRTTFAGRSVHRHPSYSASPDLDFDVAIVRLRSALPGPYAPLAARWLDKSSILRTIGWGDTRRRPYGAKYAPPEPPEQLQRASLFFVDRATCGADYEGDGYDLTWRMVCASGARMGSDGKASGICNGDSGGPLLVETEAGLQIAGLSSWMTGCGTRWYPSVFTRIGGALRTWIDACAADENACGSLPPEGPEETSLDEPFVGQH